MPDGSHADSLAGAVHRLGDVVPKGDPLMTLQWLQVRVNPITAARSAHMHTVRLGMTPERRHSLVRGFCCHRPWNLLPRSSATVSK
jgi:hypothetical protein